MATTRSGVRGGAFSWAGRDVVDGSHSMSPSSPRHGAEPSGGGCIAPPGQRCVLRISRPSEALARRHGVQHRADGCLGVRERVEDRLDAGVVAVGVVVRLRPAPNLVSQPAKSGVYGRMYSMHGLRLAQRLRSSAGRRRSRGCASFGIFDVSSIRSLFGARAADQQAQVLDGRASTPPPAGAARGRSARGPWWPASTRATSGSRSSSVARRFTKVVLALRSVGGSRPSVSAAPRSRRRSRGRWSSRCPRGRPGRRGARHRAHQLRAVVDEALEHLLVEHELLGEARETSRWRG